MPIVSIIVPVYNSERDIAKCLDSLLSQTLKDIEIIAVNDGSKDNSGKICDEYAARDSRIKVLHKENGGHSSARNAGLKVVRGEYIGFVDSDDWVQDDMYETLYKLCVENNADISVCNHYNVYADKAYLNCPGTGKTEVYDNVSAVAELLKNNKFYNNVWSRIYKKEIFDGIVFPLGKIAQDAAIVHELLFRGSKIVYIDLPKYFYNVWDGSTTQQKMSLKKASDYEYAMQRRVSFCKKNCPQLIHEARLNYIEIVINCLYYLEDSSDENIKLRKKIISKISKYYSSMPASLKSGIGRDLKIKLLFFKNTFLRNILSKSFTQLVKIKQNRKIKVLNESKKYISV